MSDNHTCGNTPRRIDVHTILVIIGTLNTCNAMQSTLGMNHLIDCNPVNKSSQINNESRHFQIFCRIVAALFPDGGAKSSISIVDRTPTSSLIAKLTCRP